jgi:hypothetical protein
MANVYNSPSDFVANPITVPAGEFMIVTDANGNIPCETEVSRPVALTDTAGSFATKFADESVYIYPLTVSFVPDPNYVPAPPVSF